MILGWIDLVKRYLRPRHEFVSADARRMPNDPRTYEMLSSKTPPVLDLRSPERAITSPNSAHTASPFSPGDSVDGKRDYFGTVPTVKARTYVSPTSSYSTPRPPSAHAQHNFNRDWDPRSTYARGGGIEEDREDELGIAVSKNVQR